MRGYMVAGVRSRRRGAGHRDPEWRLPARLVAGVPRPAPLVCRTPPSAFAWLNTKGAFANRWRRWPRARRLRELMAGRDPILVVFDGSPEQIHAASRTRISGLIMDLMLIESLGRATLGQ